MDDKTQREPVVREASVKGPGITGTKSAKETTLLEATIFLVQAVSKLENSIYGETPEKTEKDPQPMPRSKVVEAMNRVMDSVVKIDNCRKDVERLG